jgi:hypothetical protein
MWTMSWPPLCFSLCTMVPTRPLLWPPVTMARLPRSNCKGGVGGTAASAHDQSLCYNGYCSKTTV